MLLIRYLLCNIRVVQRTSIWRPCHLWGWHVECTKVMGRRVLNLFLCWPTLHRTENRIELVLVPNHNKKQITMSTTVTTTTTIITIIITILYSGVSTSVRIKPRTLFIFEIINATIRNFSWLKPSIVYVHVHFCIQYIFLMTRGWHTAPYSIHTLYYNNYKCQYCVCIPLCKTLNLYYMIYLP